MEREPFHSRRAWLAAQPWLKIGGVWPATLVKIGDSFTGKIGL